MCGWLNSGCVYYEIEGVWMAEFWVCVLRNRGCVDG